MIKLKDLLKESIGGIVSIGALNNPFPIRKEKINEYIDLSDPVNEVRDHLEKFSKALDQKAGGSFDGDAGEYHGFEGGDNKLYAKRHKQLSHWETKVNATLIRLLKDYEKAWK